MPLDVGGKISFGSNLSFAVPGGGNVFQGYSIPGKFTLDVPYSDGTGANQARAFATLGGTTTISTPVTIDALTVVRADGVTGFAHLREIIAVNGDGANILKFDPTVANSFLGPLESAAKVDIQPGGFLRWCKPLGTNGFVVDSTHHLITLDPGAFALAWQLFLLGD